MLRPEPSSWQQSFDVVADGRALRRRAGTVPEAIFCASGCELHELAALKGQLDRMREQLARQA